MKRLVRDGYVLAVPQERDKPYLYMPNPALIHLKSSKTDHFLGIVDIYLKLNQPQIFEVEPQVSETYRPDVYTRIDGVPILIEYQRTIISTQRMTDKVNAFADHYHLRKHDAKKLWIITEAGKYKVNPPTGFVVEQYRMGAL